MKDTTIVLSWWWLAVLDYTCIMFKRASFNINPKCYNNESEKAFVRTKEFVQRQNIDYIGGATC